MKLETQVCTLDQAKRLNELGVPQTSQFYWRQGVLAHVDSVNSWADQETLNDMMAFYNARAEPGWCDKFELFSAFNVAELGVMLGPIVNYPQKSDRNDYWYIYLDKYEQYKTEAEIRAAILIYRLEKGAITVAELNHLLQSA